MPDLASLINELINDPSFNNTQRISMLKEWEVKLIAHNSNRLMSLEQTELHFNYLDLISSAIKDLI